MKDFTEKELRDGRPSLLLADTVSHCLKRLFQDRRHSFMGKVVDGLTFEELIGCLLQVEDMVIGEDSEETA